jgi:hypothetical protein
MIKSLAFLLVLSLGFTFNLSAQTVVENETADATTEAAAADGVKKSSE